MYEAKSYLYGVPQGTILGPILFIIFINDIPKINSLPEITTSTTIYADDVQLLFSGTLNNLEQLKIYACRDKPKNNERMVQWKRFENEFKQNSMHSFCNP